MKKTHIIGIVVIAVAVAAIMGSLVDSSSYTDFEQAFDNQGKEYHIVGKLDRTSDIIYEPYDNPNLTVFTMIDNTGEKRLVNLYKAKPQDFERSESVVLIGQAQGEVFHATEMLMKCPSKYKENEKFQLEETAQNTGI